MKLLLGTIKDYVSIKLASGIRDLTSFSIHGSPLYTLSYNIIFFVFLFHLSFINYYLSFIINHIYFITINYLSSIIIKYLHYLCEINLLISLIFCCLCIYLFIFFIFLSGYSNSKNFKNLF